MHWVASKVYMNPFRGSLFIYPVYLHFDIHQKNEIRSLIIIYFFRMISVIPHKTMAAAVFHFISQESVNSVNQQ